MTAPANLIDGTAAPLMVRAGGAWWVRVTGAFLTDDTANAWLEQNPAHGVAHQVGPLILTAALSDTGRTKL